MVERPIYGSQQQLHLSDISKMGLVALISSYEMIGNFNWSPCVSMSNNAKCQWMAFLFKTCFKLGGKCHGASLKLVAYEYVLWLGHRSAY